MFKKIINWLKPLVKNYYLMTGLVFVVWMIFFDSNNMISQYRNRHDLKELVQQKQFYVDEITKNKAMVHDLTNLKDKSALEKFAREKYLMKKPNEEIFLIVKDSTEEN